MNARYGTQGAGVVAPGAPAWAAAPPWRCPGAGRPGWRPGSPAAPPGAAAALLKLRACATGLVRCTEPTSGGRAGLLRGWPPPPAGPRVRLRQMPLPRGPRQRQLCHACHRNRLQCHRERRERCCRGHGRRCEVARVWGCRDGLLRHLEGSGMCTSAGVAEGRCQPKRCLGTGTASLCVVRSLPARLCSVCLCGDVRLRVAQACLQDWNRVR